MASIRQNASPNGLPDLANLGVLARILLGTCLFGLLIALARSATIAQFVRELTLLAGAGLLPLLFDLCILAALGRWLRRLSYRVAMTLVFALTLIVTTAAHRLQDVLSGAAAGPIGCADRPSGRPEGELPERGPVPARRASRRLARSVAREELRRGPSRRQRPRFATGRPRRRTVRRRV